MYDKGTRVYFRDENFKACFGTIVEKVSENSALVTLKVKRDWDGKIYTIQKVNPDAKHAQLVEDRCQKYGHY